MAVRRPLIIDGGSIKELPSGDTLPAVPETAAALSHTAGAITLDVQAADVFRFEADVFTPSSTPEYVSNTSNSAASLTSLALPASLVEGDVVYLILGLGGANADISVTSPGWVDIVDNLVHSSGESARFHVARKAMSSSPDATVTFSNADSALAVRISGADSASPEDTAVATATATSALFVDPAGVTTVSDNALILVAGGISETGFDSVANWGAAPSGYSNTHFRAGNGATVGATFKSLAVAAAENPSPWAVQGFNNQDRLYAATIAISPSPASGEKDYTFTLSNIPSSGIASGLIDLELKTDTGSVAFAGGTVTWIGATPAFDAVGRYLIGFIADSTGITLWREA